MSDNFYMQRCLQLAKLGFGKVAPNPMVGAVLVYKNRIIGEGFHKKYGTEHAEVNCFNSVKNEDLQFMKDATLYVNLEPCSHFGKTPPCADLVIKNKVKKVVIASVDTANHVNGTGIEKIKKAEIEVKTEILDEENRWLNKRFFTFHEKKRPYVILKYAQTKNGFFSPINDSKKWITNNFSKKIVHKWRSEEQAILVGSKTALIDNPKLNNRLWTGNSPIRILIDKDLKITSSSNLYNSDVKTFIFNRLKNLQIENSNLVKVNFEENIIPKILQRLYQENIQSIIIEGGLITLQHFIDGNFWDEARIIEGNVKWKNGKLAPKLQNFSTLETVILQGDILTIAKKL